MHGAIQQQGLQAFREGLTYTVQQACSAAHMSHAVLASCQGKATSHGNTRLGRHKEMMLLHGCCYIHMQ